MKNLLSVSLILTLSLGITIGCSSTEVLTKKGFINECHSEKNGLPMSQIGMLYDGYKEHEDYTAYKSLKENCPKAVKKHLK